MACREGTYDFFKYHTAFNSPIGNSIYGSVASAIASGGTVKGWSVCNLSKVTVINLKKKKKKKNIGYFIMKLGDLIDLYILRMQCKCVLKKTDNLC